MLFDWKRFRFEKPNLPQLECQSIFDKPGNSGKCSGAFRESSSP